MYRYNLVEINKAYADFNLDVGLPQTIITLGEDRSLEMKCFMAWHALSCAAYSADVTADANRFAHVVTYYDKYEIPTCYRRIEISWVDFTTVAAVAGIQATGSVEKFFSHVTQAYLVKKNLLQPIPLTRYQRLLNWFQ
jgi:hypothetical protein